MGVKILALRLKFINCPTSPDYLQQGWFFGFFFNQELLLEILAKGQFPSMHQVTLLNNCVMHSALRRLIGLSQYLTTHFCLHDCGWYDHRILIYPKEKNYRVEQWDLWMRYLWLQSSPIYSTQPPQNCCVIGREIFPMYWSCSWTGKQWETVLSELEESHTWFFSHSFRNRPYFPSPLLLCWDWG